MMHPYLFEKLNQAHHAELQRRHKHTWPVADLKKSGHERRLSHIFRSSGDEILQRKAYLVLEEMLQHENGELRLRAAEIILRRSRSPLLTRILDRF